VILLALSLSRSISQIHANFYSLGHVARVEDRDVHRVLVEKPEGKRPLGLPRRRWEDNIKMDLQEGRGVVGTGWSWLRIGTGGGHLWVR
jgi:hypothetical protein